MDCCGRHNAGLNTLFDEPTAREETRDYLKNGLRKPARRLAELVAARGVENASLLEVGGGVGGLHLELLKRGAASAYDVDVSASYVSAAQNLAARLGLRERVNHQVGDFAQVADSVPAADVVVLHRVVCCYPDMPQLLNQAARHANRLLAFSFPWDVWPTRVVRAIFNTGLWLGRSGYRFYVHPAPAMRRVVNEAGFKLVSQSSVFPWQMLVFERTTG